MGELVSNTNKNQGDSSCRFEILTLLPKSALSQPGPWDPFSTEGR